MNIRRSCQYGIGKFTAIFFLILFGGGVYAGYEILPFYYNYFEIQNQMQSLCDAASVNTDAQIRDKLSYHLKKMDIPVTIEDVRIVRGSSNISMSLQYEEVFSIPWQGEDVEIHTFDFEAYAEADLE